MGEKGEKSILERLVDATFTAVKERVKQQEFDKFFSVDTNVLIDAANPIGGSVLEEDLLEFLAGVKPRKKHTRSDKRAKNADKIIDRPNIITITETTRDELDGNKKSPSIGARARQALESFAERFLEYKPIMQDGFQVGAEFPNGSLLILTPMCSGQYPVLTEDRSPDHQQVAVMLRWREELKDAKGALSFRLISLDYNLRVTARQFGIVAERPRASTVDVGKLPLGYVQIQDIADRALVTELRRSGGRVDWRRISAYASNGGAVVNNSFLRTRLGEEKVFLRVKNGQVSLPTQYDDAISQKGGARFLEKVRPTELQRMAYDLLLDPDVHVVSLVGPGSSGKTSAALTAGLHQVIVTKRYTTLFVTRPYSSEDSLRGFMPGQEKNVLRLWMRSVFGHLETLLEEGELEKYTAAQQLQFEPISYFIENETQGGMIIVRDAQNLSKGEMKAIGEHIGAETKIVFVGDMQNVTNPHLNKDTSGLGFSIVKMYNSGLFGHVTFSGPSSKSRKSKVAQLFRF